MSVRAIRYGSLQNFAEIFFMLKSVFLFMEGNRKQFSASRQILMRDAENKETFSVIFF